MSTERKKRISINFIRLCPLIIAFIIYPRWASAAGPSNTLQGKKDIPKATYLQKKSILEDLEKNIHGIDFKTISPIVLKNKQGVPIFYLEDNELPIVTIRLAIKTGSFDDPAGKEGLSGIFSRVWRLSGSKKYPGRDINAFFEFIGGKMEVGFNKQYGVVTLSVLKKYLKDALPYLVDFLVNPSFEKDKLELVRGLKLDSLKRSKESPFSLAMRYFKKEIFTGTVYSKISTLSSIKGIGLNDLKNFYKDNLIKERLSWIISGNLSKDETEKIGNLITFAQAKGSDPLTKRNGTGRFLTKEPKARIFIINRKLPQATIIIGGPSIRHNDPRRIDLLLANYILGGGGFNSQLMQEIRSNRGLAYSVGSVSHEYKNFGVFFAYGQTKIDSAKTVIGLMKHEMERLADLDLVRKKISWAKASIINQFVFLFNSTPQIALRKFEMKLDEMPDEYLERFTEEVRNVKPNDIRTISEKIFRHDKFSVIIVGPADILKKSLSGLGFIKIIEPRF